MDKNIQIVVALLILIIGFGAGYAIRGVDMPSANMHVMENGDMMSNEHMGMNGAMDDMMQALEGKTGDEFDKTFLTEMIVHHQGAVAMAEAALRSAKHQEIKEMAKAILAAQTSEIEQMQEWSTSWYNQ